MGYKRLAEQIDQVELIDQGMPVSFLRFQLFDINIFMAVIIVYIQSAVSGLP